MQSPTVAGGNRVAIEWQYVALVALGGISGNSATVADSLAAG